MNPYVSAILKISICLGFSFSTYAAVQSTHLLIDDNIDDKHTELQVSRFLWLFEETKSTEPNFDPLADASLYRPYTNDILDLGYVDHPLWLRLNYSVADNYSKTNDWYLSLGLAQLSQVEYRHYLDGKLIYQQIDTHQHPFHLRTIQSPLWILPVYMARGDHLLLIRLGGNAMIRSDLQLQPVAPMMAQTNIYQLIHGLLIGFFGFLMVYTLIVYGISREPVFVVGFGLMCGLVLLQFSTSGLGIQYLWSDRPEFNDLATRISLGLTFAMLGLFPATYLGLSNWSPRLGQCIPLIAIATILVSFTPTFGSSPAVQIATLSLTLFFSTIVIIKACLIGMHGAGYFLGGLLTFALLLVAFVFQIVPLHTDSSVVGLLDSSMMVVALSISFALVIRLNDEKIAAQHSEQVARSKSAFLASMSHEIRTPMNGVLGMLNLMAKGELNTQQRQYSRMAKSSAESLLVLLNDILDFSKIEAGKMELEELEFDLVLLMEESVEAMAIRAQEKKLEITLDVTPIHSSIVTGDPGRLRQILTNLISNAIKFTTEGEVIIKAFMTGNTSDSNLELFCSVTDSGIGISQPKIDRLFENYSQADASIAREYGGTGLGLSIAKYLTDLMQGSIGATSTLGQGSRFWFTAKFPNNAQTRPFDPSLSLTGKHMLVIEPHRPSAQVLTRQLTYWHAKVTAALDNADAERLLKREPNISHVFVNHSGKYPIPESLYSACKGSKATLVLMCPLDKDVDLEDLYDLSIVSKITKPITRSKLQDYFTHKPNLSPAATAPLQPQEVKPTTPTHRNRILLVEDNRVNQQVASGILAEFDITPDIAENGELAIATLRHSNPPYSLVFMDCQMPVMDGYDATRQIRNGAAGEAMKSVPIIAMTANVMKGDKEKCLDVGMNAYLAKPIDTDELNKVLHTYLGTSVAVPNNNETKKTTDKRTTCVWNKSDALKRVRGNMEYFRKIVMIFLEDTQPQIEQLNQLILQSEMDAAADVAHAIKGVTANLSGVRLCNVVSEIEVLAKAGSSDELHQLLPSLNEEFKQLKKSMMTSF